MSMMIARFPDFGRRLGGLALGALAALSLAAAPAAAQDLETFDPDATFGQQNSAGGIDADLASEVAARLAPFIERGLARMDNGTLHLEPGALPYARTIAALFDPYRQDSVRRFSSAV